MANGAYWHLASNHIPVMAIPFISVLLFAGLIRKSNDLIKASYITALAVALFTIFVWKSGDAAEGVVHELPGIQLADIDAHEKAADFGFAAAEILGVLSLVGLYRGRGGNYSTRWGYFVVVVALWAATVEARVAHLGGLIRHSEIRAAPATPKSATPL